MLLFSWYLFLLSFTGLVNCQKTNFTTLIISQQWEYELNHIQKFENNAKEELAELGINNLILKTHEDFDKYIGSWGIWSILIKLLEKSQNSEWILIVEPFTKVNWKKLLELINDLNPTEEHFLGRALVDEEPVIIHHFYGFQGSDNRVLYPDFAAGVILSRETLKRIAKEAQIHDKSDFTIDNKHEFAKFIRDSTGIELKNVPEFCLLPNETECIMKYEEPKYLNSEIGCVSGVTNENIYFAVKTFSGYHKTRIVYVKRTWAKEAKYIDFFSDIQDEYIPTIKLAENTKRGHCQKTMAIMKHFLKQEELKHVNWLVVADDDTLFNVKQLQKVINCLPVSTKLILGERYGFGFEWDGLGGYDYPTGGSGFIMSRESARFLSYSCDCPKPDAEDDMIIGLCARRLNIPILHSSAFHQTQRRHYNPLYIKRITPVSFHKFEDLDVYKEYADYLQSPKATTTHTEL